MAKRKNIDWEAIEKEYRIGQKTLRTIASEHSISHVSIINKAKKRGWIQNKSDEVRQKTQAGLIGYQEDITKKITTPTREDIEKAVQTNIEIVRSHRKTIKRTLDFAERLLREFEQRKEIDPKIDNRVFLSIAQGLSKIIPLDRQAFNIDSKESLENPLAELLKGIGTNGRAQPTADTTE